MSSLHSSSPSRLRSLLLLLVSLLLVFTPYTSATPVHSQNQMRCLSTLLSPEQRATVEDCKFAGHYGNHILFDAECVAQVMAGAYAEARREYWTKIRFEAAVFACQPVSPVMRKEAFKKPTDAHLGKFDE